MSTQPSRLDAASVRLEPIDLIWLEDVEALAADPQVRRFTRIPEPPPAGFARDWIERYSASGAQPGPRAGFTAVDRDGDFVGLALAPHINRDEGEVELGYMVAERARGRGAGTAMLGLLTRWAFDELAMERAYLIIDVRNQGSIRVAERCGYTLEGVMRSIRLKAGQRIDAGLWSRLPSDPEPSQGRPR